jgi:Domain of unknown function (DUF4333)
MAEPQYLDAAGQSAPRRHPVYARDRPPAATPPGTDAQRRKAARRRLMLIGGLAIVLIEAVVFVVVLWQLEVFDTKVLDVRQAEAGVQQILSDPVNGYGANDVSAVRCNDGENPPADKGYSFTCEVDINGAERHVVVVIQDDNGTYAVDGPR